MTDPVLFAPDTTVACRTCAAILDRYDEFPSGTVSFRHPVWRAADHRPVPVRADVLDAQYSCDFCCDEEVVFAYTTAAPIRLAVRTLGGMVVREYGTHWAACLGCAELVDAADLSGLHDRVMFNGRDLIAIPTPLEAAIIAGHVHDMLAQVLARWLPQRAVSPAGRWQPQPLAAAALPKVRDRLTRLFDGEDFLPCDLGAPDIRTSMVDGLAAAGLYWIDDEFTQLTLQLAPGLPEVKVNPADPPAPQGLLGWAQPVGRRIVAASWAPCPGGLRIVGYRSVGAGLAPPQLQRLREQVGWLVPAFATLLRPGELVDAAHPAAALVTAWRLIRQRLAETAPVRVGKTIRNAYRRAGRPEPQVRLARLRGRTTARPARQATGAAAGAGSAADRDFRWWVGAHWRYQPVGLGRTERDWVAVRSHLRGPDTKPIKASTSVRVLGALPPRPTGDTAPQQ